MRMPMLSWTLLLLVGLWGGIALCGEVTILSTDEFIDFANSIREGSAYFGSTMLLGSDIDFAGKAFEPIGDFGNFLGVFDGQGHVISNLNISSSTYASLFGYSTGETVKNFVIDSSCSFSSSNDTNSYNIYLGGVIGYCYSLRAPCIIENNVNMGRIFFNKNITDSDSLYIGGVAGGFSSYLHGVTVRNCVNYGPIFGYGASNDGFIGGVVGYSYGYSTSMVFIQNCLNYGPITFNVTTKKVMGVGGVVGYTKNTFIENCVGAGKAVSGVALKTYVGGVNGFIEYIDTNITHCHWTSDTGSDLVNGTGGPNVKDSVLIATLSGTTLDEMNEYAEKNNTWSRWVMLHLNGGNINTLGKDAPIGGLLKSLPIPVKEEHSFLYWCKDEECNEQYNPEITEAREVSKLYAKWLPNNYTITFDGNGGIPSKTSLTVTYNSTYGDLPTAGMTGYTFIGWFTEEVGGEEVTSEMAFIVAGNKTLYAHWAINQYTVTFNLNNGTEITSRFTFNDTIIYPESVAGNGYTFNGWTPKPERMAAQNITITAQWNISTYAILFDFNNGTKINGVFAFNDTIEYPVGMKKDGYTFNKWVPNPEMMPAENITVTAQWSVTNPSEYAEVIFSTKDLSEEEAKKIIVKYTTVGGEEWEIVKFVVDKDDGTITMIIKFTDKEKASEFIWNINENKRPEDDDFVRNARPATDYESFSPSFYLCTFLSFFYFLF